MKTLTHASINYLIAKTFNLDNESKKWFICGGFIPDLFIILVFTFLVLWSTSIDKGIEIFSTLYNSNSIIIIFHSLFHSPISILIFWVASLVFSINSSRFNYFLLGCLTHIFFDVFTHSNDDGPLLFWPFSWSFRINSGFSHWDCFQNFYYVASIELFLNMACIFFLLCQRSLNSMSFFKGMYA